MKIISTGHPSYRVTDRERALRFYCGCLGLKKKFTITYGELLAFENMPEDDPWRRKIEPMKDEIWLTYLEIAPHQYLELFHPEGATERYNFPLSASDHIGYLHLALEVDDIFAAYEELRAKPEVRIVSAPKLGIERAWQFWIEDPDGNSIELMQYEPDAWQLTGHGEER